MNTAEQLALTTTHACSQSQSPAQPKRTPDRSDLRYAFPQSNPRGLSNLLNLARANPSSRFFAFLDDWSAVDHFRARVDAAGLSDQIHIHHRSALHSLHPSRAA